MMRKIIGISTESIGNNVTHLFVKKWGWGKRKRVLFVDLWVDLIDNKNNNLKNIKVED
jgi:hypothetical protein